ncbi:MAG: hypothetical protein WC120_01875 [Parcubacteria group bacterium]
MKKNKLIVASVFASVLLAGIFSFSVSNAEEMPEPVSLGEIVAVAEVNIFDAKIVSQEENKLKLSFDLSNGRSIQPDVRYAVRLIGADNGNQAVADELVYAENLDLKEDETVLKEIEYVAPTYLSGRFQIWLVAQNQSGLDLALAQAGEISLAGNGKYVEIVPDSCYLKVEGEPEDKTYSLIQGVDVKNEEKLIAVCELSNHFESPAEVTPIFKNYWRSTFGKPVATVDGSQPALRLAPGEKKPFEIVLSKAMVPQAYDAVLELADGQGKLVSNKVTFHYVLRGPSATIQNLRLDKDYYQKGETAQASIYWTPAADNFYGARFAPTENSQISLAISIKSGSGASCSDNFKRTADPEARISDYGLPITADCADPKIVVSLEDSQGNVLDRKEYVLISQNAPASPESEKAVPPTEDGKYDPVFLYLGILGAVLAIAIIALVFRNKRSVSLIVFFIFGSALFMHGEKALAATYVVKSINSSHSDSVYTVNLSKSKFFPGDTITVYGTGSGGVCGNGDLFQYLAVTSTDGSNSVSNRIIDIYADQGHWFVANGTQGWQCTGWRCNYITNGKISFAVSNVAGAHKVKFVGQGWGSSASFSLPYTVVYPPTAPTAPTLTGPATGLINTNYNFTARATDINNDKIRYGFDWDNNNVIDQWMPVSGYVSSGTAQTATHQWSNTGAKRFKVRACDTNGSCSAWSALFTITISAPPSPCALPWGGTTPSGTSVTAYNTTQACDCTTADQTRTCTNGILSGTYTNRTCLPIPSVVGACGTANGQELASEPTSGLCSSGNPSAVSSTNDSWDWTCNGICSTVNVSCSADRSLDLNWKEVNPN